MGMVTFFCKNIKLILSAIVIICGILFHNHLGISYNDFKKKLDESKNVNNNEKVFVYSQELLARFNGVYQDKLYLALMGNIYDVTVGKQFYEKGATYNYFIGKDGTRAFVTGNFKDNSEQKDHILDLSCKELFTLFNWKENLRKKYEFVGVLDGRYFDQYGERTEYSKKVYDRMEKCMLEKEILKEQEQKYPPCNIAWSAEDGTRVWCTKTSGGVIRSWEGVPRQFYRPGEDKSQCVCVNFKNEKPLGHFKEYNNCSPTSLSCIVS